MLTVPAGTDDARPTTAAQAPEAPSGAAGPVTADQANDVINQIFRAGLVLAAAAQLDHGPSTEKIATVIDELDTTIRHVRAAVFEQSPSGLDHAAPRALARATDCLRAVEASPVFADIDPGNEPATPTRAERDVEDRLREAGQLVETALRQVLGHICLSDGHLTGAERRSTCVQQFRSITARERT